MPWPIAPRPRNATLPGVDGAAVEDVEVSAVEEDEAGLAAGAEALMEAPLSVAKSLPSEDAALVPGAAKGRAQSSSCSAWLVSGEGNLRARATARTSAVFLICGGDGRWRVSARGESR